MKKMFALCLILVAASLTFAIESKPNVIIPSSGNHDVVKIDTANFHAKFDSIRQAAKLELPPISKLDSDAFHHDVDTSRSFDTARRAFGEHKMKADSIRAGKFDTARAAEFKAKMDSLRQNWVAKRDTQIARIKDTAVKAQIQERVKQVEAKKAEVKARIAAKKAQIRANPSAPVATPFAAPATN